MRRILVLLFVCFASLAIGQLGGKAIKKKATNLPTQQHQVALTWTQSSGPGTITGNNVYRCTGNACTNYAVLYSSSTPIVTYTDTTVVAGSTYTYVVTALAGIEESAYSNQFVGVIPTPPSAPTGLTGTSQ